MPDPASPVLASLVAFLAVAAIAPAAATASAASPATLALPAGCEVTQSAADGSTHAHDPEPAFPPVQLDIRTPFEPSAFRAGGYTYLVYELRLQNYAEGRLPITGIEVLDAAAKGGRTLLTLSGPTLNQQLGRGQVDNVHALDAGRSAVVYLCLAFEDGMQVPSRLRHRVLLQGTSTEGPTIGTRHTRVKTLASPVQGRHWLADNGLALDRHHRSGLFVAGGSAQIARRYAIDWKQRVDGEFQSGDPLDVHTYHAYAQPVFAVADAVVIHAKDGLPDNVPRTPAGFTPALPLSMETIAGNTVVLDLGDGQFAHYAHLQPDSVSVKVGQRVQRGQLLGRIGNSGDARWPHLHFQVTTGPDILDSEGVPFAIDRFRARDRGGNWSAREREFPLGGDEVSFGEDGR